MSEEELREVISEYFTFTHTKVMDLADEMMVELKRPYFITPSLFIELVKGYSKLLVDK
jgi:dynein heavy chain